MIRQYKRDGQIKPTVFCDIHNISETATDPGLFLACGYRLARLAVVGALIPLHAYLATVLAARLNPAVVHTVVELEAAADVKRGWHRPDPRSGLMRPPSHWPQGARCSPTGRLC